MCHGLSGFDFAYAQRLARLESGLEIQGVVARDGIEPPTPAFLRAADLTLRLRAKARAAGKWIGNSGVVARDGIEPPTPAFLRAANLTNALARKGSRGWKVDWKFRSGGQRRD